VLFDIVTGDESWFHHFVPETNDRALNGIIWHLQKRIVPSADKVMDAVECIMHIG